MKRTLTLAFSVLVALALVALARPAAAQNARGFNVNRFEPSERGSDWFSAESLDLRGAVRPSVGVVGDYMTRPLVTTTPSGDVGQRIIENTWTVHAGATLNIVDRFRLAVSAPFIASMDGTRQNVNGVIYNAPASESGLGDLRFGADVRIGGVYGEAVTIATGFRAWAPTGDEAAYTGDNRWKVAQKLHFAGEVGIFAWGLHVGFLHRARNDLFDGTTIGGNGLTFGAAAGLKLVDKRLQFGPEIVGLTLLKDPFSKLTTPVEGLFGARFAMIPGLRAGAAAGIGLLRGIGAPDLRVLFAVEFTPPMPGDKDGDGIIDKEDACPDVKGKRSADPAKNGCPEPTPEDKDGDGIVDKEDACVDVPGVKTSDPKTNGCPPDTDGDGVIDKEDACVDVPGVKTSDPKTNGCPADTDGDGIIDKEDACPNEAGIKTDDPKTNGCPDNDIDKDGVLNHEDACPDEPGPADPDPKKNGCPKAFIKADQIKITDQVKFKTNSAQILPGKDSEEILLAVAKVLKDHPEVKKVRIEGHTDNVGTAAHNLKLSASRADSVAKWLVAHGVAQERLTSQGFGEQHPISSNKNEAGRRDNRRVEFHIEKTPAP